MSGALQSVYKKLFTSEDKFNAHKTLGIACLGSYIIRFVQVGPSDMAFGATNTTLAVLAMHFLLSVSSLVFKIPHARIKSGYRIWPEYRIHSIVFACRSLTTMLLTWVELRHGLEPNYKLNAAIVLCTIAAADLGSEFVGGPVGSSGRSNSIRDLEAGPATRFFFSAMQFHATMGCLFGLRRFSTQFIYVWIIQLNAFLMTIRRKNLAGHETLVTIYGLMLTFGFAVASYEHSRVSFDTFLLVNTLGNLAGLLRLGLRMPKYPLWILMAVLTQVGRDSIDGHVAWAAIPWGPVYAASVVALLSLGAKKIFGASSSGKSDSPARAGNDGAVPAVASTAEALKTS